MDSFLMVRPTGQPLNEKVGAWTAKEMEHAVVHWRQQYRGDARMTTDDAVSDADIASSNLVLWGDPSSNKILAKIAGKLPIKWTAKEVTVGGLRAITVGAAQMITVGAAQAITVVGSETESYGKNHTQTVGANQGVSVAKNGTYKIGGGRDTEVAKDDRLQVVWDVARK